ncbi:general secretion pathway protein GspL [Stakelama sp. CBK3Z-3]|uniref:General secretion pathway protein GspL n=1 Tax=Stakelama flava TaxID=2860338 RepID=A0ABS6XKG8_9SPHN|nr:general secretion pathway protein GspL [Stakelama flava]
MRGIWTFSDAEPSIIDPQGPATILVPCEAVRLLTVDLPLSSRAKRREALPFAIEDRIAEAPETVHLALGEEIAPKRYLVGVVRHEAMEKWIAQAQAAGLSHATMVPDALALPVPPEGHWAVELTGERALVRTADGGGFALPAAMLEAAWRREGEPATISYGAPLPDAMRGEEAPGDMARLLERPALDLRQGPYARRSLPGGNRFGRRLAWILGIGIAAHATIATADTILLRSIADRRAAEVRALAGQMAPGAALGDDLTGQVADMIPTPVGDDRFVLMLNRVSAALAPLSGAIAMHSIRYRADAMTLEMGMLEPDALPRIRAALSDASIDARVTGGDDGTVRVVAMLP